MSFGHHILIKGMKLKRHIRVGKIYQNLHNIHSSTWRACGEHEFSLHASDFLCILLIFSNQSFHVHLYVGMWLGLTPLAVNGDKYPTRIVDY